MCLVVFLFPYYFTVNASLVISITYYYEISSSLDVFSRVFFDSMLVCKMGLVIRIAHYYVFSGRYECEMRDVVLLCLFMCLVVFFIYFLIP